MWGGIVMQAILECSLCNISRKSGWAFWSSSAVASKFFCTSWRILSVTALIFLGCYWMSFCGERKQDAEALAAHLFLFTSAMPTYISHSVQWRDIFHYQSQYFEVTSQFRFFSVILAFSREKRAKKYNMQNRSRKIMQHPCLFLNQSRHYWHFTFLRQLCCVWGLKL